ncbi:hypothetical protein AREALGSMS7_04006 [Arenibacter algicola]|uniref:Uncharacterized protein n=1 Tax=Arenibacter algicola TaxID=616991 RepID=A0A221V1M4_9FLAO|nr:hypothetical protein AREALGSMS7_04006 [Arenibacter algicola]
MLAAFNVQYISLKYSEQINKHEGIYLSFRISMKIENKTNLLKSKPSI